MNSMPDAMSRKGFFKATTATREAQKAHRAALEQDPRWRLLKPVDRRHMRLLLAWHNPLNGYLQHRTRALNLTELLDVTAETLRTSRWRLIEAGLIVSYSPGTGHIASTYCIARSWAEADEAAKLRTEPDRPHWPALVDDTPCAVGQRSTPVAPADEDQAAAEETAEETAAAEEQFERARRRRGVRGPVPPELPAAQDAEWRREVVELRSDLPSQIERDARGGAAARAALKRTGAGAA